MRKVFLILVMLMFVSPVLNSCTDPNEIEESNEVQQEEQFINHDELGGDVEDEDGDIDMETAG